MASTEHGSALAAIGFKGGGTHAPHVHLLCRLVAYPEADIPEPTKCTETYRSINCDPSRVLNKAWYRDSLGGLVVNVVQSQLHESVRVCLQLQSDQIP